MITIYMITNKLTGYRYIGQTKDFKRRLQAHKSGSRGTLIGKAIKHYGPENFKMKALYDVENDRADEAEIYEIIKRKTLYPNGYNLTTGGKKDYKPYWPLKPKKPFLLCVETGKIFKNTNEARKATAASAQGIRDAIACGGTAAKFHWAYIENGEE